MQARSMTTRMLIIQKTGKRFQQIHFKRNYKVRSDIKEKLQHKKFEYSGPLSTKPYALYVSLGTFKLLDIQSTTELIKAASTKGCKLDPILTTQLKANIREITPTIYKIITNHFSLVGYHQYSKVPM